MENRKNFFLTLFVLLSSFWVSLVYAESGNEHGLIGNVKAYSILTFNASEIKGKTVKGEAITKTGETKLYLMFDRSNNKYSFNEKGLLTEVVYVPSGVKSSYKYNSESKVIEIHQAYLKSTQCFDYSVKGKILMKTKSLVNNSERDWVMSELNPKGFVSRTTSYFGPNYTNPHQQSDYGYDQNGNLIWHRASFAKDKELIYLIKYEYNAKGLVSKADRSSEVSEMVGVETYTYEFDAKGNWIKKNIKVNGVLKYIQERKITY